MRSTADASDALRFGMQLTGWTSWDLWLAGFAVGGDLNTDQIDAIAAGRVGATRRDYEILAAALDERLHELGHDHPMVDWGTLPSLQ